MGRTITRIETRMGADYASWCAKHLGMQESFDYKFSLPYLRFSLKAGDLWFARSIEIYWRKGKRTELSFSPQHLRNIELEISTERIRLRAPACAPI